MYGSIQDDSQETQFVQKFILSKKSDKYLISNDSFFSFKLNTVPPYYPQPLNTSISAPHIPKEPIQPSPYINPHRPKQIPQDVNRYNGKRISKYQDFDSSRSITVMNLMDGYGGPAIVNYFERFGKVEKQYFTHNTVYIMFDSPNSVDDILKIKHHLQQGSSVTIGRGIVPREEQKNFNEYHRGKY